MEPTIGTCRLCLLPGRELQDSHIMPRWAYKRARGNGPNPVMIRDGSAVVLSKQEKEYLLCKTCEQLFSTAEKYAAEAFYQQDGTAPLLTMLREPRHPLLAQFPIFECDTLDWASLVYFSASIFWRMHISSAHPNYLLGPHAESLRQYLVSATGFPSSASLVLTFDRSESDLGRSLSQVVTFPIMRRHHGYFAHTFAVFGFHPLLVVGQRIPATFRRYCAAHNTMKLVLLQSPLEVPFGRVFSELVRDAVPRGKAAVALRRPA